MGIGPFFIYVLRDPETRAPRYVGQTTQVKQRRWQHARGQQKMQLLDDWVQGLRHRRQKPVFEIVQECETLEDALSAEGAWAMYFTMRGFKLYNKSLISCPHCGQPVWTGDNSTYHQSRKRRPL